MVSHHSSAQPSTPLLLEIFRRPAADNSLMNAWQTGSREWYGPFPTRQSVAGNYSTMRKPAES